MKMKPDSVQKLRKATSPSENVKKVFTKASPSGGRGTPPSTSLETPITGNLKPAKSSRMESPKTMKKHGGENTSESSLSRRRSLDRPPVTASRMQKVLSSGPRERSLTIKPSSRVGLKSTVNEKPTLEAKSKSMPKAITSRATVSKTAKKGPAGPTIKSENESSDLAGLGDHEVDVVTKAQIDCKAAVKEVDPCEKAEGQDDFPTVQQPELQHAEYENTGKSVTGDCQDDVLLEHHQDVSITENVDDEVQREEIPEENIVLEGKIGDVEHHEQGNDNHHEEEVESIGEMGVIEVAEKPEEFEQKEVLMEETVQGDNDDGETMRYSSMETVPEVGDENGMINKPNGEQGVEDFPIKQAVVKPSGGHDVSRLKIQRSMGKDSPVYNDVIEETASKLLEKRKNKVRALVGAFETVISLQEPQG